MTPTPGPERGVLNILMGLNIVFVLMAMSQNSLHILQCPT
jgi:hypothetical protein